MGNNAVIVISGPTATGKTALGVELCLRRGGEVISADSMQVYKGMDVGTAKVTAAEAQGVPHHMIDVALPSEAFSAARWVDMAAQAGESIFARGKLPVIVGGTGLYIDSLLSGRGFASADSDNALRARLNADYEAQGGEALLARLRAVDPERAAILHPADRKRIVRALEVFILTGQTITQHDAQTRLLPPRWNSLRFALCFARRETLYRRIDDRVDAMIAQGLFEEVEQLLHRGLRPDSTAMQAIGYKEAVAYIAGELSRDDCAACIKQASRRYAKRQLTWLRRDPEIRWIVWEDAPDPARGLAQIEGEMAKSGLFNF